MSEAPNLYEEVLSARGREPLPAARPPRGSAAIILWRRTADGQLQIYWVRRSDRVRFMPGWHAFIGGSVSRADREVPVFGEPRDLAAQVALDSLPPGQRAEASSDEGLVACALRELFEEVGLLVARGPIPTSDVLDPMREAMLEEPADFADFLRRRKLQLDASRLTFAGRWLTPPLAPLRFDTRFYLLHWLTSETRQPDVWPGELDHGEWISPGEAQERWLHSLVMAAPPIVHTLSVLAREGPEAGLPALQRPIEAELGPFRRVEFRPGIRMFPLPTATLPP
ncbi:MAG: NUDIX domain-containing protein, partial [Thermoanaerobaculia bacterium]|nr:NUDIX domain-containing protein [Thermoanaerobaculia bacterium]